MGKVELVQMMLHSHYLQCIFLPNFPDTSELQFLGLEAHLLKVPVPQEIGVSLNGPWCY